MIYLQLLWVYLQIGLFGFGGGYAMLSLIQHEVVEHYGWITDAEFAEIVALSQVTPGPIGINSATYIGYQATGSVWGSVVATVAVCLPSFILMLLLSYYYNRYKNNYWVVLVLRYLRLATIGLIASAAISLMNATNFTSYWSALIFISAFVSVYFFKLHPIAMIVIAGIVGCLFF